MREQDYLTVTSFKDITFNDAAVLLSQDRLKRLIGTQVCHVYVWAGACYFPAVSKLLNAHLHRLPSGCEVIFWTAIEVPTKATDFSLGNLRRYSKWFVSFESSPLWQKWTIEQPKVKQLQISKLSSKYSIKKAGIQVTIITLLALQYSKVSGFTSSSKYSEVFHP